MKFLIPAVYFFWLPQALSQNTILQSRGNSFNPDSSINTLFLFENHKNNNHEDGFKMQEVELQFSSDVDAYFRAQIAIGIHEEMEEHEEEEEGEEHKHNTILHIEEAFVETINIDNHTLKAGQFYVNFGKYNPTHTHALPFIYRSYVQRAILSEEGLMQTGVGYSRLISLPWFSELTLQFVEPNNEHLFGESKHALASIGRLTNLWDLNDELTMEWGLSGLNYSPKNSEAASSEITALQGTDLTFKWRPLAKSIYRSFIWSTEYINKYQTGPLQERMQGVTSFMRHQFARRWYFQLQYESLDVFNSTEFFDTETYSTLFAFKGSEFSLIRLQYDQIDIKNSEKEQRILLQMNLSIGAHPAHQY